MRINIRHDTLKLNNVNFAMNGGTHGCPGCTGCSETDVDLIRLSSLLWLEIVACSKFVIWIKPLSCPSV